MSKNEQGRTPGKSNRKLYAVGRAVSDEDTGIYTNWFYCKEVTHGVSGSAYKSFHTPAECVEYLKEYNAHNNITVHHEGKRFKLSEFFSDLEVNHSNQETVSDLTDLKTTHDVNNVQNGNGTVQSNKPCEDLTDLKTTHDVNNVQNENGSVQSNQPCEDTPKGRSDAELQTLRNSISSLSDFMQALSGKLDALHQNITTERETNKNLNASNVKLQDRIEKLEITLNKFDSENKYQKLIEQKDREIANIKEKSLTQLLEKERMIINLQAENKHLNNKLDNSTEALDTMGKKLETLTKAVEANEKKINDNKDGINNIIFNEHMNRAMDTTVGQSKSESTVSSASVNQSRSAQNSKHIGYDVLHDSVLKHMKASRLLSGQQAKMTFVPTIHEATRVLDDGSTNTHLLVQIGTNDITDVSDNCVSPIVKEYCDLIEKATSRYEKIYCSLPPPRNDRQQFVGEIFNAEVSQRLAKMPSVVIIDNSNMKSNHDMLFEDNTHPNEGCGSSKLAANIRKALGLKVPGNIKQQWNFQQWRDYGKNVDYPRSQTPPPPYQSNLRQPPPMTRTPPPSYPSRPPVNNQRNYQPVPFDNYDNRNQNYGRPPQPPTHPTFNYGYYHNMY